MSIFNATAPSGGGGEVKEYECSASTASSSIDTITTSAVPSWWVLVGLTHGGSTYVITAAFNDGTGIYNRSTANSANVTGYSISTISASISNGKLKVTNSGGSSSGRFYGTYRLYYIE